MDLTTQKVLETKKETLYKKQIKKVIWFKPVVFKVYTGAH